MKKIVAFIILILFWLIILFPKDILWNNFTNEMSKKNIDIVAKEVDIKLWILHNQIKIKDLTVLKSFKANTLEIQYSVTNPLHVNIKGNSQYGEFEGEIKLFEKSGFILLKNQNLNNSLLKEYFKQDAKGMRL